MQPALSARTLSAALLLAWLGQAARADDPTPDELLTQARVAQGGAAWDALGALRLTGKLENGGLTGTYESLTDARTGRFRDRFELGPMRGANGWDGTAAWSQDSSGFSRTEAAETPRRTAVNEAYRRSQSWWRPDHGGAEVKALGERRDGDATFQVLELTPAGGRPFELWIRDGLFARIVEQQDGRTYTTFQSDWREVGGAKVPFAVRTTNGDGVPEHDTVVAVERAEPGAPAPADAFARPASPRPDSGFTRGRTSSTVPFQVANGHIYVDVKLDGKGPFRLLVDTGGVNIVTPATAQALGLATEGKLAGGGVGEKTEDLGLARVKRVQVGDAFIEDQTFLVYPMDAFSSVEGVPQQGLIGYELFRRFAARIDYDRRALTLFAPEVFRYQGRGTVLPFTFNAHVPQVDGAVDGIAGKFDLDNGSRASLDLLAPFVAAHGLVEKYGARTVRIDGWGVGGPARGYVVRAQVLRLGDLEVRDVVTGLSAQQKGAFASTEYAGNVGYGVLSRFTVLLDYAHLQVILEPGKRYAQPDVADRSGLWIHAGKGGFEVIEAVPGTPAAEAGLAEGDRILAVDGKPAGQLTLPALRLQLKTLPPGRVLKLRVQRGDAVRTVALTLRDLV
jgi:hypothetical protein